MAGEKSSQCFNSKRQKSKQMSNADIKLKYKENYELDHEERTNIKQLRWHQSQPGIWASYNRCPA